MVATGCIVHNGWTNSQSLIQQVLLETPDTLWHFQCLLRERLSFEISTMCEWTWNINSIMLQIDLKNVTYCICISIISHNEFIQSNRVWLLRITFACLFFFSIDKPVTFLRCCQNPVNQLVVKLYCNNLIQPPFIVVYSGSFNTFIRMFPANKMVQ